jgi:hypothetical protein
LIEQVALNQGLHELWITISPIQLLPRLRDLFDDVTVQQR